MLFIFFFLFDEAAEAVPSRRLNGLKLTIEGQKINIALFC